MDRKAVIEAIKAVRWPQLQLPEEQKKPLEPIPATDGERKMAQLQIDLLNELVGNSKPIGDPKISTIKQHVKEAADQMIALAADKERLHYHTGKDYADAFVEAAIAAKEKVDQKRNESHDRSFPRHSA